MIQELATYTLGVCIYKLRVNWPSGVYELKPDEMCTSASAGVYKRCMSQLPGGAVRLKTRQNVYECKSVLPDQMCVTAYEHSTVT